MSKQKRNRTPVKKAKKKRQREHYETIFVNGKQKRVKRAPSIDGLPVDEFIKRNANPIELHQNEMRELIDCEDD